MFTLKERVAMDGESFEQSECQEHGRQLSKIVASEGQGAERCQRGHCCWEYLKLIMGQVECLKVLK